jgi:hypothetical protein
MVKVKYDGPAQITERRIAQDDLGGDVNEDGSSDYFVWNAANDFTVEMPSDMAKQLLGQAPNFSILEEDAEGDADAIDDQVSEPAAPKASPKGSSKKGTPKEA